MLIWHQTCRSYAKGKTNDKKEHLEKRILIQQFLPAYTDDVIWEKLRPLHLKTFP